MSNQVFAGVDRYQPKKATNKYSTTNPYILIGGSVPGTKFINFDNVNGVPGVIPTNGNIVYPSLIDPLELGRPITPVILGVTQPTVISIEESGWYVINGVFSFSLDMSAEGTPRINFNVLVLNPDDSIAINKETGGFASLSGGSRYNFPLSFNAHLSAGQKIKIGYFCSTEAGGILYTVESAVSYIKSYVEIGRL